MNSEMLGYLQKDQIGKVIAKALASVYTNKPDTPVKYLAQWLKNYSANQRTLHKLVDAQSQKKGHLQTYHHTAQVQESIQAENKKRQDQHLSKIHKFNAMVEAHDYQEELLEEIFPEFAEKLLGLTGVYIGHLDHPSKKITDSEEDEHAHLNTAQPKLINYIGSSKSHKALMHGNTLPLDKGVTSAAFSLSLDDLPPVEGEEAPAHKDKYVYVTNVVKNDSMHYFRLPKLGAYIAIPLVYQSSLKEHIFDVTLETRIKELAEIEEFKKAKEEDLKELEHEKTEIQKKIAELLEKNAEESAVDPLKEELADCAKRHAERHAEQFQKENVELPKEKREFVFCADSMGSDKEIAQADRELLVELVRHFRNSWEKKESELLNKDVEFQISLQHALARPAPAEIEHLDKCQEVTAEAKAVFDQVEDEVHRNYKTEEWQLHALKTHIEENHGYAEAFLQLAHFRVPKFKELIQQVLFFLKHEKHEINLPGKTIVNWKKVRVTHIVKDTFHKIVSYVVEGPKTDPYPDYCKTPALIARLEHFHEAEIFQYNIGLGAVTKFIIKALKLREKNVEMRKLQKEAQRKAREAILEENEKIKQDKRQALEKHKSSLPAEDVESFNEEEWSAKYDEQSPLKEVPAEVVGDIDNDMESQ